MGLQLGKLLMLAGVVLLLVGAAVWALGRVGFRGLPGDIRYESDGLRVYIPIVTCLVISALLTLALWAWRHLSSR